MDTIEKMCNCNLLIAEFLNIGKNFHVLALEAVLETGSERNERISKMLDISRKELDQMIKIYDIGKELGDDNVINFAITGLNNISANIQDLTKLMV